MLLTKKGTAELVERLVAKGATFTNFDKSYFLDIAVIEFEGSIMKIADRARIQKTNWYDDETEAPENNFENFRIMNLRHNYLDPIGDRMVFLYREKNGETVWTKFRPRHTEDFEVATDEQKQIIEDALTEYREKFEKRLRTYWKKYSDHVSVDGYWVNR